MKLLFLVGILATVLASMVFGDSTFYDNSLKPKSETEKPGAKVHRSINDIVARATSKIGKKPVNKNSSSKQKISNTGKVVN